MSEYQIVKFRAVDRPITDKQMEYMDHQSSRAEFTRWEFEVDYHYSSFHGDVDGMLRNGYDIYLEYSNCDSRQIKIRLPSGLPFPKNVWSKYFKSEGLTWTPDKKGKAGIISVSPFLEMLDPIWEYDEFLDATAKVRELLIAGDLRALYLLWLCCASDSNEDPSELMEPPVPHGLDTLPEQAKELLEYFDVDPLLVDAAAVGIPKFTPRESKESATSSWAKSISEQRRTEIVQRLLLEDPIVLQSELLSEMRESQQIPEWPVEQPTRTLAQLLESCDGLREKENDRQERLAADKAKREAAKAEKQRQARMEDMKSAPEPWLVKATELTEARGPDNYHEVASILADLREAIGGEAGEKIARKHAAHLAKKFPTLHILRSSLRKKQLLD